MSVPVPAVADEAHGDLVAGVVANAETPAARVEAADGDPVGPRVTITFRLPTGCRRSVTP